MFPFLDEEEKITETVIKSEAEVANAVEAVEETALPAAEEAPVEEPCEEALPAEEEPIAFEEEAK